MRPYCAGVEYEDASGNRLSNLGQKKLTVCTEDGARKQCLFQVADVSCPLGSVKAFTKAGYAMVFDDDGSYALHKRTGWWTPLRERNNAYFLDLWIEPSTTGF